MYTLELLTPFFKLINVRISVSGHSKIVNIPCVTSITKVGELKSRIHPCGRKDYTRSTNMLAFNRRIPQDDRGVLDQYYIQNGSILNLSVRGKTTLTCISQ